MKILNKIIILIFGLFLFACEEVIVVDLDTAPPRLVIEASIDWQKNTTGNEQKIIISTTSVSITNTTGTVFDFTEISNSGEYVCNNFVPVIGETYALTILLNGETYSATETLIATPTIEDTIEQNNTGGFGGDEVEITYYYQDDAMQENYYFFGMQDSNIAFPQYSVEDDENSQGSLIPVSYSSEDLKKDDIVSFKLYGISRRYFEYLKKLLVASGNDDGPFQSTPTLVRGNIVNQTNSNNFTFGYFKLSEVDVQEYTIQ